MKTPPRIVPKIIIGVVVFVIALIVLFNAVVIVEAGNVQVLTQFGRTVGVTFDPGLHFKVPFVQSTTNYSTRQVTYETSDHPEVSRANYTDFSVDTTSSDGQQVQLKYTIRFSIDGAQAEWVLNNIGTMDELVEKVVKAEARSLARNIPKKYTAFQLYSEQVFDVQEELESTLRPRFSANGIILDEFLLRKIDFTDEYFTVLEEKQIAEEKIVVERNILEQEKIRKEQTIIKAEAEAEQIIIRGQSLRVYPEIIQLEFIQKLSPNISWGILPDGIVPLIDLGDLHRDMDAADGPSAPTAFEEEIQAETELEESRQETFTDD